MTSPIGACMDRLPKEWGYVGLTPSCRLPDSFQPMRCAPKGKFNVALPLFRAEREADGDRPSRHARTIVQIMSGVNSFMFKCRSAADSASVSWSQPLGVRSEWNV